MGEIFIQTHGTEDGNVNLTSKVPKEPEVIEELMNNGKS